MTEHVSPAHHPAPQRDRVAYYEAVFGLIGGPAAWFLQLNVGYAIMSQPCFPGATRVIGSPVGFEWTAPAALAVYFVCLAIAFAAFLVAWRSFRMTRGEVEGGHRHALEVGSGRTRFLALWGMLASGGFTVVILANIVGLLVVPPCA
jgi:hypothetical protein